jgi:hypothetical protein
MSIAPKSGGTVGDSTPLFETSEICGDRCQCGSEIGAFRDLEQDQSSTTILTGSPDELSYLLFGEVLRGIGDIRIFRERLFNVRVLAPWSLLKMSVSGCRDPGPVSAAGQQDDRLIER